MPEQEPKSLRQIYDEGVIAWERQRTENSEFDDAYLRWAASTMTLQAICEERPPSDETKGSLLGLLRDAMWMLDSRYARQQELEDAYSLLMKSYGLLLNYYEELGGDERLVELWGVDPEDLKH